MAQSTVDYFTRDSSILSTLTGSFHYKPLRKDRGAFKELMFGHTRSVSKDDFTFVPHKYKVNSQTYCGILSMCD